MNSPPAISSLRRGPSALAAARACAFATSALAGIVLWSWVAGVGDLLTLSLHHVPMAPSTALALGLLASAAWLAAREPPSARSLGIARAVALLTTLAGTLVVARHAFGWGSPLEEALSRTTERLNGVPLGQMSSLAGGLFVLLSFSLLLLLPPWNRTRAARAAADFFAALGLLIAVANSIGYLRGEPWFIAGTSIPMAFFTGISFGLLGLGLLALSLTPRIGDKQGSPGPLSRNPRTSLAAVLVLTLFIAIVGALYLRREQEEARVSVQHLLEAIGKLKVEEIVSWRQERLSDANFFASAPFVARDVREFLANPASERARREVMSWLTLLKGGSRYVAVTLLDAEGKARLAVEEPRSAPHVPRDLVAEAFARGSPVISDLRREADGVHMDVAFPVLSFPDPSGRRSALGSVVLCIDPRRSLFSLLQSWPTPSRTAETVLFHREGNEVVFLNELRHVTNGALNVRFPITPNSDLLAVRCYFGKSETMEGRDYRGIAVLGNPRSVTGSPWHLIAKVDREEIYGPLRQQAWLTLALTAFLALSAGLLVHATWHRHERASQLERLALAERYRFLFDSMLNGFARCRIVLENDRPADFVYLDVNLAFERLTGLKNVVGKPVSKVIPGIRESNPELLERYGRVARTGKPEQFETFVSPLGTWFSMSVYSTEEGTFAAVFENINQRKEHEREIARLTRLYATLSQINQAIVRVHSNEELFREVCRVTAEFSGMELAWVGWLDPSTRSVVPVARAGPRAAYVDRIRVTADQQPEGRGPVGTCIREGQTCLFNDFLKDGRAGPWREAAAEHGLRSVAAMPIRLGGEVCGAFAVYAAETHVFRDKEVALLEEAAMDISFALDHLAQEGRRREAEAKLLLQNAALNSAANAIMITDREGRIEWANPAFASLTGYSLAEAAGKNPREILRSGTHDVPFYEKMWKTILDGQVWRGELVNRRKDGSLYHEDMTITPVTDEAGAIHHFVAVKQDISDRKKADEALRVSEEQFRAIFDSATVGITQADPSTRRFLLANPRMCAITGYSRQELLGLTVRDITHPDDRDLDWKAFQRVIRGEASDYQLEKRYLRKDGSVVWVSVNMTLLRDRGGKPVRTLATIEDVTPRKRAEEAQRQSEQRLRLAQRAAKAGTWEWDLRTNANFWSEELWEVYGIPPHSCQPSYEAWLQLVPPADREPAARAVQRAVAEGSELLVEWRIRDRDGAERWLMSRGQPFRDATGRITRYLGIVLDISDRKRMEEERELSVRLLGLFNESNSLHEMMRGVTKLLKGWLGCDAVGVRLQEGDDFPYFETQGFASEFVHLENALCVPDEKGCNLRDELGHPVLECMCGNVLRRRFDASKPFFTERGSFWSNGTTELLATSTEEDRQGRTRNRCNGAGYESVALIALRVGQVTYGLLQVNHKAKGLFTPERLALLERLADSLAVAVAHRRGQKILGESEERLRLIAETIDEVFWMTDPDFKKMLYVSPAYARVWGRSTASLYDDPRSFLEPVHPDDRMAIQAVMGTMKTGAQLDHEFRIRRPNGAVRWIWNRGFPIKDDAGGTTRYIGVAEDITARKEAEETLGATNRQLEAAMAQLRSAQQQLVQQERLHALGQMASGIAHDFNNALMPILGYTELLLKRPGRLGEKRRVLRALRLIQTAASDAAQVVRRLREFYRHREQGEVFLPVQLNSMVQQTVELTRPRWEQQSEATGISIRVKTDLGDIPSAYGNEAELREALTNLIFNAVDSMPRGGTLTLRTRAEGDRVTLAVSDTGTGMTEEVRRRCLEPFFSTKGEHGTGLGLAMVHGIIRRHEGSLEVESAPGKGCTFTLILPVDAGGPVESEASAQLPPSTAWKVLVVDDDPRLRDMLLQDLGENGHRVETSRDGLEAAKRIHRGSFDLVISDRAMPGMSGDQLAEVVKRESPTTKVVLLTGFGDIMKARGEHPSCVDLVIPKPISLEKLHVALVHLMHSAGDPPPSPRKKSPASRPGGQKPRARRKP